MKKTILLFALITSTFLFSQEFEGISIFKLGKFTTTKLDSLVSSKKLIIKTCDDYSCSFNSPFVQLIPSKIDSYKSPTYTSFSDNVKVYQLNGYKINDRYNNRSIVLSFYKDILFKINISEPDSKLTDDLELKYGKGDLSKRDGTDNCRIGGESFELPSVTYSSKWNNSSNNFSMLYLLMSGRNSDCEERILTSLTLYDKTINEVADTESRTQRSILDKKNDEEKRKKLNDL